MMMIGLSLVVLMPVMAANCVTLVVVPLTCIAAAMLVLLISASAPLYPH